MTAYRIWETNKNIKRKAYIYLCYLGANREEYKEREEEKKEKRKMSSIEIKPDVLEYKRMFFPIIIIIIIITVT